MHASMLELGSTCRPSHTGLGGCRARVSPGQVLDQARTTMALNADPTYIEGTTGLLVSCLLF